jgi:Alpha/beta hydrolase family
MRRQVMACCLLLAALPAAGSECVVLLHGMLRTARAMEPMAEALAAAGYQTVNVDYPSREAPIETLAPIAVGEGLAGCRAKPGVDKIDFVTHSLGGILLRQYLAHGKIPELGRVVMLGPPNQGSAAADRMRNVPGFDLLNGPAARELGQGEDSVPLSLPPADFEVGIIAGNRTIDPVTSAVLPDPDDGKVSVEDTKLEGMRDFIVVDHSHAFMMRMQDTIELTIRFLRTGSFSAE